MVAFDGLPSWLHGILVPGLAIVASALAWLGIQFNAGPSAGVSSGSATGGISNAGGKADVSSGSATGGISNAGGKADVSNKLDGSGQ